MFVQVKPKATLLLTCTVMLATRICYVEQLDYSDHAGFAELAQGHLVVILYCLLIHLSSLSAADLLIAFSTA